MRYKRRFGLEHRQSSPDTSLQLGVMMGTKIVSLGLLMVVAAASAVDVYDINQLGAAKKTKHIVLHNIHVPAGVTLDMLKLQPGTLVEFVGQITFGYQEWDGPLIRIGGRNIKVVGKPGHLINCQGERWWDFRGGHWGKKKPSFFSIRLSDSSIDGLNVKNLPVHGFSIYGCKNLDVTRININVAEGTYKGAFNTDGFDVGNSQRIRIANSWIHSLDDCLAINSGTDITFEDNTCIGGHGISIGSIGGRKINTVQKVRVKRCKIQDSENGIRIKTVKGATGSVKDIVYDDIELKNIGKQGIVIQGNYLNSGPQGDPTWGVPIEGVTINNVRGNVLPDGVNVHIWVAGASNWKFSNIHVWGGTKDYGQKGVPPGVKWW